MNRRIFSIGIVCVIIGSIAGYLYWGRPVSGVSGKVRADKILIEKKAHRLTIFASGKEIKRFKIAIGRGGLRKKLQAGDKMTPEGLYHIDNRNPNSGYHLALHISYPNTEDIAAASRAGVNPGGDIMIHGIKNGFGRLGYFHTLFDWTLGCVALRDSEIDELWEMVPDGTEVEIRP